MSFFDDSMSLFTGLMGNDSNTAMNTSKNFILNSAQAGVEDAQYRDMMAALAGQKSVVRPVADTGLTEETTQMITDALAGSGARELSNLEKYTMFLKQQQDKEVAERVALDEQKINLNEQEFGIDNDAFTDNLFNNLLNN